MKMATKKIFQIDFYENDGTEGRPYRVDILDLRRAEPFNEIPSELEGDIGYCVGMISVVISRMQTEYIEVMKRRKETVDE